jgi:hypothetical protein
MSQVDAGELALTGDGGFLPEMIKAVLERGLAAEQTAHLGYERGDPAGRGTPNSRNGTTPKTVATEVGDVALDVPRDRAGTFEPRLVPKGSRRTGGLDEMIISLYAGGMTVRDIAHHLQRTIGTELSHDTISKITDGVLEEVKACPIFRAVAPAGGDLPDRLPGRAGDQGAGRAPGPQPVRAPGRRGRSRRGQARARDLGAGIRGGEVLGRGVRRAAQPRGAGRADRLL